jgi:secreted Zn-dependent insulinase-like peptidase
MAQLLSSIERHLFRDLSSGKEASALKSEYLQKYQITARHFNAIRIQLAFQAHRAAKKSTN